MNKFLKPIIGFMFITLAISFANTAQAASKEQLVKKGNALFSSGKYDEAISTYDEAAVDDPESPYIYFNKGTALYKKEDYAGARDAFRQAAIKTKNIALEAKSKFNLGLCFFREGDRQKDSDLKKTLEAYESSVQSFQEVQALDPKFFEAAENIEMVRLMMKSLLDQIKKQEEEAQKKQAQAQKTAKKIKELIEKQKNLLTKSHSLMNKELSNATPDKSANQTDKKYFQQNKDIADAQEQLKNETQIFCKQLANQGPPTANTPSAASPKMSPPLPEHPSKHHLDASVGEQEKAVDWFSKDETQTASDHQQTSLDNLNKALEALMDKQKNQQQQQGNQQAPKKNEKDTNQKGEKDKPQPSSTDEKSAEKNKPDENKPDENQQQTPIAQLADDANNIIDEEKENKKQRMPLSPDGFKKVDKDW